MCDIEVRGRTFLVLNFPVIEARNLAPKRNQTADPYGVILVGKQKKKREKIKIGGKKRM